MTDVDELTRRLREAEAALEATRNGSLDARAENLAKDQFLAVLSHELRTPLSAILGWTQLLLAKTTTPEQRRGLEVIERNARAQAQLIEDLLDVSSIISGHLRLELESVDLCQIVSAATASVRPAADNAQVTLELVVPDAPLMVLGDATRLQQIALNLLGNAVKFTPQGGRISARLEAADDRATLHVVDTGEGIAKEQLAQIFEPFRQGTTAAKRRTRGLGLGLAIVRQLAEAHGGTAEAKSEGKGKGATFSVHLPLKKTAAPPRPEEPPPESAEVSLDGLGVLVVDDDADTREMVQRMLSARGASVVTASSAAEALAWIDGGLELRVLITDVAMPGTDGLELVRLVRQRGFGPAELPAIVLTAFVGAEDQERASMAGAQAHLPKPIDFNVLLAEVVRVGCAERRAET
jgi:CheY-like chemotaxis protein/nitrogen-specific signal transduction histidine kinase